MDEVGRGEWGERAVGEGGRSRRGEEARGGVGSVGEPAICVYYYAVLFRLAYY